MILEYFGTEKQIAAKDYDPNCERIHVKNADGEICCVITITGASNARENMAREILTKIGDQ